MEKEKYYPVDASCIKCKEPLLILKLAFSDKGNILIQFGCGKCGEVSNVVSSWTKIMAGCHDDGIVNAPTTETIQ